MNEWKSYLRFHPLNRHQSEMKDSSPRLSSLIAISIFFSFFLFFSSRECRKHDNDQLFHISSFSAKSIEVKISHDKSLEGILFHWMYVYIPRLRDTTDSSTSESHVVRLMAGIFNNSKEFSISLNFFFPSTMFPESILPPQLTNLLLFIAQRYPT